MRPRGTAKSWRDGREEVCRYRYEDNRSELLFYKVRYSLDPEKWNGQTKDFAYNVPVGVCRRAHNGNKCSWQQKWEIDNCAPWRASFHPHAPIDERRNPRWLYRLPEALEAARRGKTIHWTEGEKDADAIRAAGGVAVSVHQGACKATLDQARWLLRARKIVIWADKDWLPGPDGEAHPEVGAYDAALRHDLLRRAGYHADRIAIVRAKGDADAEPFYKDAADHVARYGLRRWVEVDREALRELARQYVPRHRAKVGVLVTTDDLMLTDEVLLAVQQEFNTAEESEEDHLEYLMTDKEVAKLSPIEFVVDGWFAIGNYTYLYGDPGIGKTFLLLDVMRSVRAGGDWAGYEIPARGAVIFYQGEGVRQFQKRTVAWDERFRDGRSMARGVSTDKLFDLTKPESVAAVVRTVQRYEEKQRAKVRLLVIEPLVEYMTGEENGEGMEKASRGLRALARLLPHTAVVAGHHTNAAGERERGAAFLRMRCGAAIRVEGVQEDGERRIGLLQHKQRDGETQAAIFRSAGSAESIVWEVTEQLTAMQYVMRKERAKRDAQESKQVAKAAADRDKILDFIRVTPGANKAGMRKAKLAGTDRIPLLIEDLIQEGLIKVAAADGRGVTYCLADTTD